MTASLTGNQTAMQEGRGATFPISGEALRAENLALLQETIWASSDIKAERAAAFDRTWQDKWHSARDHMHFEPHPSESPFSEYTGQGWKLHITFQKGEEAEVSKFMYEAGLYFKTQAGMGTWFNGNQESGSTIYVGSHGAMTIVADHLTPLRPVLMEGPAYLQPINGKRVYIGSGSDIEIAPDILARFDVQKSPYGLRGGTGKYAEDGLPSWTNAYGVTSALPILTEDVSFIRGLEKHKRSIRELLPVYREVQQRAEQELIGDFGHDFVVGPSKVTAVGAEEDL